MARHRDLDPANHITAATRQLNLLPANDGSEAKVSRSTYDLVQRP